MQFEEEPWVFRWNGSMSLEIRKIVYIFEVPRLRPRGNREVELTARVEVFENSNGKFCANVWFMESYRILPTSEALTINAMVSDVASLADKSIYALEDTMGFEDMIELTPQALEERILQKLGDMFTRDQPS